MTLWHFEFYRVGADGGRTGSSNTTDGSPSIDLAIAQAKSVMQNVTFPFGKANVCLIKNQDETIIRKVEI